MTSSMATQPPLDSPGAGDLLCIGAWSGVFFGLLEGVGLCLTRFSTLIEAAHKVSNHALYVPVLIDLPVFLVLALAMLVILRLGRRWIEPWQWSIVYGSFALAGAYTVLSVPRRFHQVSVAILSLGLAAVITRRLRGNERKLASALGRRWFVAPLLVSVAVGGVFTFESAREAWMVSRLPATSQEASNVLILVMDTVRADFVSRLMDEGRLPSLKAIAAQGTRFDNAWSTTSWSLPSQASILTGRYPHVHGADWPTARLRAGSPNLPTLFGERGYLTGAFSGNSAWITPEYLGTGFQRFEVYQMEDLLRRTVHGRKINKRLDEIGYHSSGRGKPASEINRQLLRFIDDYPNRPYFAYVCYMDVNRAFHDRKLNHHDPEPEVVRAYEQAVVNLDAEIGRLLSQIRQREGGRKTLLVVTSDHGESFGAAIKNDYQPTGHGTSLYREQLQVPLMVSYHSQVSAGAVDTRTVSIYQIPATILKLLGIEDKRFKDPLEPGNGEVHDCVVSTLRYPETAREDRTATCPGWRYVVNRAKGKAPEKMLFDRNGDPLEETNRAGTTDAQAIESAIERKLKNLLSENEATSRLLASGAKRP